MTGYELSRQWFDWSFENPHLSTPNHTALYLWYVEKWNRCGQKEKFSVTTSESMEAIGIKSRNTLSNTFKDLVAWNFIIIVTESKNQHSCSVISLAQILSKHEYSTVASTRTALDKALIQHEYSTVASTDTINKQDNKETSKQDTEEEKEKPTATDDTPDFVKANRDAIKPKKQITKEELKADLLQSEYCRSSGNKHGIKANFEQYVNDFVFEKFGLGENTKWKDIADARSHFVRWIPFHKNSTPVKTDARVKQSNIVLN